ncbi:putative quinol monooxygenase [Pigmentibacter ruber]
MKTLLTSFAALFITLNAFSVTPNQDLKKALIVTVKAKPGKGKQALDYLASTNPLKVVANEKETKTWYFVKLNEETFYVFDTFTTEEGRNAHIAGDIPKAVNAKPDLFFPLEVKKVDIIMSAQPK